MATRKLEVQIVGDSRSLERALGRSQGKMKRFAGIAARATAGLSVGAAGAAGKMIDLASDAEETASKFKIVFGKEARNARDELDKFSKAAGTSRFALRDQAAGFQALIRPMGVSAGKAADMSVGLTKLATDLASFNNTSVEDAMIALKSGLVGEAEPLRRFGVQLSAARVQAFAYSSGIAKTGKELTAAQKSQAAYSLILKDTKLAQGDAVRTSGSFANQLKRLKATVTDNATELGTKLLPAATAAVGGMTRFIQQVQTGTGIGGRFRTVVSSIGAAVGQTVGRLASFTAGIVSSKAGLTALAAIVGGLVGRFAALGAVWAVGRIVGFAAAIAGVVRTLTTAVAITTSLRGAITLLTASMATNPFGALALVIGTVAGAFLGMKLATQQTKVSADQLNQSLRSQADALRAVRDIDIDVAQRKANLKSANVGLAAAEKRVNDLRRAGKLNTAEGKAAEADLAQARVNQKRATRDLGDVEVDSKRKRKDATTATKDAISASRGRIRTLNAEVGQLAVSGASHDKIRAKLREVRAEHNRLSRLKAAAVKVNVGIKITGAGKEFKDWGGAGDYGTGARNAIAETAKGWAQRNKGKLMAGLGTGMLGGGKASSVDRFNAIARRFGNSVTSGFRPGDPGWHGKNRARDYAGGDMMGFARFMAARFGKNLLELIYTPLGFGIKNGRRVAPYARADHYDHVHVAMRQGGRMEPHRATAPTTVIQYGEEAPRHPEYFISTNPRDRKRSMGLLSQAAQEISGKRLAQFRKGGRRGPGGIPWRDWQMALKIGNAKGVDPLLLVAIGLHETGWGKLGDGRKGNILGYGSADSGSSYKWAGVKGQLSGAAFSLKKWGATNIKAVLAGKAAPYASDPKWESKVWATMQDKIGNAAQRRRWRRGGVGKGAPAPKTLGRSGLSYADHIALADLGITRAERTPGSIDNLEMLQAKGGLLRARTKRVRASLRKIDRQLKGKLTRKKRAALLQQRTQLYQELGSLTSERQQIGTSIAELNAPADAGDGGDSNQALIDAQNAAAEAARQQTEALNSLKDELRKQNEFSTSVANISSREAVRALADVMSGQIGSTYSQRSVSAGAGTLARF